MLSGQPPTALDARLAPVRPLPGLAPTALARVASPQALLLRRPDIAAAARGDAALAAYEKTVLEALEETEGALAAYTRSQRETDAFGAARAADQAAELARALRGGAQRLSGGARRRARTAGRARAPGALEHRQRYRAGGGLPRPGRRMVARPP